MKNAVRRAGFRPLTCGRWHILLRPAALNIAAVALLVILLLALFGLTRGSFPMPSGTLFHALLGGENVGEQQRFILFDIRLPRLFMALLCGAMLGLAGAAMQSITRNGLADPGLIGVKEGASIVVLALVLFFRRWAWSGGRWRECSAACWWRCWFWRWPAIVRARALFSLASACRGRWRRRSVFL